MDSRDRSRGALIMQKIIERLNGSNAAIGITIAIITIYAAVIGMLQMQASNLNTQYRADTQRYAIAAMQIRSVGETQATFDTGYIQRMNELLDQQEALAVSQEDGSVAGKIDALRDALAMVSPMLQPPYVDNDNADAQYEVDTYLKDAIRAEQYLAASAPLDAAWDSKANTYVVHLTLLAVVLALLGLGVVMVDVPRLMVLTMAVGLTLVTLAWSVQTYVTPVPTINDAAITAYTEAYAQAYVGNNDEALTKYDEAIRLNPDYANAYYERAWIFYAQSKYPETLQDLASARRTGFDETSIDNLEGYVMMLQGNYAEAQIATNAWLKREPDHLVALGQHAAIQYALDTPEAADATVATLVATVQRLVQQIRTDGNEPDEDFWYTLADVADIIADVQVAALNAEASDFPPLTLTDATVTAIDAAVAQIRSTAITLEYNVQPGAVTTNNLSLGVVGDDDTFVAQDAIASADIAVTPLAFSFEAANTMPDAQVIVRIYMDGVEDTTLRYVTTWDDRGDGMVVLPIPIDIGPLYELQAGSYAAELYIDGVVQGNAIPFSITE